MRELEIVLRKPHDKQKDFIESKAKRKVIRAGRRGGKTIGISILSIEQFVAGKRVLYTAPTYEQTDAFWNEIKRVLAPAIESKVYTKNESMKTIEVPGKTARIKAKTAWNADTMRGDTADLLIFDEWQLANEDAWEVVGAPMLLDNDGDAVFIYTPPSLVSTGVTKAKDPRHAARMFKDAQASYEVAVKEGKPPRWQSFHFTSWDNPYISHDALEEITKDMSQSAYRQEIMAEDDEINPSHLIYNKFSWSSQKLPRGSVILGEKWPRFVGHDFGGANPAAIFFAQDPSTGYFYAYHEYLPGGGRSTAQHVEEFKRITIGTQVVKRSGGSHQEDEVRQGYTAHGWPIIEPKINNVLAGIDKVRGLMELNKVFIFDNLVNLLSELAIYRWKLDNEGKPTDEIEQKSKYHLMDAMRYILSDFTPETNIYRKVRTFKFL